jgi:membrane-associated phospholipid phosphatase
MRRARASHHTDKHSSHGDASGEDASPGDHGDASRQPSSRGHRPDQPGEAELRRNLIMLAAGVALLALAAAFAAVMAASPTRPFTARLDRWWLSLVTSWQAAPLTQVAKVLSYVVGPWGGTIVVAILVILLLWRRRIWTAVFLALAEACGSGCSQVIKHLVERPRPPHPLVQADFGSFPSGHVITTTVVGLTLVAALARPGRRTIPLTGVAVAVATIMFCRTYLRAHWLSDTFEGVLVGAGIALVLWALFTPVLLREQRIPLIRR